MTERADSEFSLDDIYTFPYSPVPKPEKDDFILKHSYLDIKTDKWIKGFVTLQKNGKLVVWSDVNPLVNDYNYDDDVDQMADADFESIWQIGSVLQLNRRKQCKIMHVVDLSLLFPGTKIHTQGN